MKYERMMNLFSKLNDQKYVWRNRFKDPREILVPLRNTVESYLGSYI
jgi:hypothetical protein